MAAFIAMTSWRGEFTDEFFAQPAPDPAGTPSFSIRPSISSTL
jgi:hypothetical protein